MCGQERDSGQPAGTGTLWLQVLEDFTTGLHWSAMVNYPDALVCLVVLAGVRRGVLSLDTRPDSETVAFPKLDRV